MKKVDNRYQLSIPWNNKKEYITDNKLRAIKRLKCTGRQLQKNNEIGYSYKDTIQKHE